MIKMPKKVNMLDSETMKGKENYHSWFLQILKVI